MFRSACAAFSLLLLVSCFEPVNYSGKECSVAGDCPVGYTCMARKCFVTGTAPPDGGVDPGPDPVPTSDLHIVRVSSETSFVVPGQQKILVKVFVENADSVR